MRKLVSLLALLMMAASTANAGISRNAKRPPTLALEGSQLTQPGTGCDGGVNLLANSSFEGTYSSYIPPGGHPDCPAGICTTAQMAPNWSPWWLSHNPSDPGHIIRQPEYKPADPIFNNPPRVRSGDAAQQFFTFFSTHRAGMMQQLPVTPGETYRFCAWGHAWSADDDDDALSGPNAGILNMKVGIDPTGGTAWPTTDSAAPNIVWGAMREQYDSYGLFEVEATAQSSTLTVYTFSQPTWAVKHNDVYWDDAGLIAIGAAPPPEMSVSMPQGLTFLAGGSLPAMQNGSITVDFINDNGVTWQAVDDGGSLPVNIAPASGGAGGSFTVSIDATGMPAGVYQTTTTVTASDPTTINSPIQIPITLVVAAQIYDNYLPLVVAP